MAASAQDPALVALVVNDDDAGRYVTARILKQAGYRVTEAGTGGEALARAQECPDVVVLDVKLPDIDGFEVARRLKADPRTAAIPILQTSAAYITAENRARGLDSGADGYLVQPFEDIELVATLAALLRARRAEDVARRLAAGWQATFDAIGDGVCLLDRDGRVRQCNRALAHLLGEPVEALLARSYGEVLAPRLGSGGLEAVRATSQRHVSETAVGPRWFRVVVDPVAGREGALDGFVLVAADTTDRHRLEQELRDRAGALAEADRRKDEFLAMLAHELRNPLSAIGAALAVQEALSAPEGPGARVQETLSRQTRHLARLVDDLLDVSRITHDKIELRRSVVDLVDLTRRALAGAEPLLAGRGTRLAATLPERPLFAHVDPVRVEQVIVNLLGNASKFSPAGAVVEVSLADEQGRARLRVRDRGIGISSEMLDSVFDMFMQVDQSAARSRGGLGIGLTMVKKLVELHGGTVAAESPGEGRGSTFTIALPLVPAPEAVSPAASREGRRPTPRLRVLLIEDNADIAELIGLQLGMWGHEVTHAADGPRGLEAALSQRPDVALLDVGLPGLDGYELARKIRAAPGGTEIRLIAMTGYGRPEDRERAREAGFDAHLVKPVDPPALQEVLEARAAIER